MRTRVASSDWCASRNVVSVTPTVGDSRSQRANASGPPSGSRCREPSGGGTDRSATGSLVVGSGTFGRGPLGRFTVTSAR